MDMPNATTWASANCDYGRNQQKMERAKLFDFHLIEFEFEFAGLLCVGEGQARDVAAVGVEVGDRIFILLPVGATREISHYACRTAAFEMTPKIRFGICGQTAPLPELQTGGASAG
jgi:hypothetical protein